MVLRCYLCRKEGDCVYMCVWRVLFVLGGGVEGVCAARGLGWCASGPQGNLSLLLSFYTFLKGLYSFYLRKRDQPTGKRGPKVGKLMTQQLKVQQTPGHRHKIYTYNEQKNLTNQRHE